MGFPYRTPPASFLLTDYPMRIVILSERSESKELSSNLQHLTSFHSITCALFRATEHSQPICYQSLPHSFPCNRGWGVVASLTKTLLLGLRIDGLVEINPEDARKKRQHRSEGQENHERAGDDLSEAPTGQKPKDRSKSRDERETQAVTDVHGPQKISGLAVEEQIPSKYPSPSPGER